MTTIKWRWEVRAPDGRVWHSDNEHVAKKMAAEFNRSVPRGGKLAVVVTLPA